MGLGLGPFELMLIFGVLLLLFGAKRLPELASGMGKGIRDFKSALAGAGEQAPPGASLAAEPTAPAVQLPELAPAAGPAADPPDASGTVRQIGLWSANP